MTATTILLAVGVVALIVTVLLLWRDIALAHRYVEQLAVALQHQVARVATLERQVVVLTEQAAWDGQRLYELVNRSDDEV